MSSGLEVPSTDRIQSGGTIHVETDNLALLAQLRENSLEELGRQSKPEKVPTITAVSSFDSPHSSTRRERQEPVALSHSERTIPSAHIYGQNLGVVRSELTESVNPVLVCVPKPEPASKPGAKGGTAEPARLGERNGQYNFHPTSHAPVFLPETGSSRPDLIPLASAKSCQSVDIDLGEEADDEGGNETEDGKDDVNISDIPYTDRINGQSGDQGSKPESQRAHSRLSAPGVSSVATALPPGGRVSVSSIVNPAVFRASSVPSPDWNSPEHRRFVTPYSSRRLKDKPIGRNSAVSTALIDEHGSTTTLSVPEDQKSWNKDQAARLKAGERDKITTSTVRENSQQASKKPFSQNKEGEIISPGFPASKSLQNSGLLTENTKHKEADAVRASTKPPFIEKERTDEVKQKVSSPHHPDYSEHKRSLLTADAHQLGNNRSDSASGTSAHHTRGEGDTGTDKLTLSGRVESDHALASLSGKTLDVLEVDQFVERVYVDSPSFTREEEEEYRFVSSRIENEDGLSDSHLTYRGLDKLAVRNMEGATNVNVQPTRKPFKQVRYQDDEDRFEDREEILQYSQAVPQPKPSPQTQYVLRSKTNSAEAAENQTPQPVKGLTLPSGPSYDPEDEEDLKREASYQQELKNRVDHLQRTAEETIVPQLPGNELYQGNMEVPEDMEMDRSQYQQHRDSVDIYEGQRLRQNMHNAQWGDPPPLPQHKFGNPQGYTGADRGYADQERLGYASQDRLGYTNQDRLGYANQDRLGYVNQDRLGYANPERFSYADQERSGYADSGRQKYADPQTGFGEPYNRERYDDAYYAEPQTVENGDAMHRTGRDEYGIDVQEGQFGSAPYQSQPMRDGMGYAQQGYAEPRDGYYLTEPRGYSQKPAPIYNQDFVGEEDGNAMSSAPNPAAEDDRYQLEGETQRPTPREHPGIIGLPQKPDYDYVSHNRVDYGFSSKRTYKKIHETKRGEEEKLTRIFIHPKVKPRNKKGSRDTSPARPLAITYNPGESVTQGAEDLWSQRSAYLAQANNSKVNRTKKNPGSIPSLVSQSLPSTGSPTNHVRAPVIGQSLPMAGNQASHIQLTPALQPLPQISPFPYQGDVMQPGITQHLVTEDGQRISVDVNLRLISPPVGTEGEEYAGQQPLHHTGMQYPVTGVRNPGGYARSNSHDYSDAVYTTNPYKKIPPIGTGSEGSPNSAQLQLDGSYMLSYLREKEKQMSADKPWYRVYGIRDYKRMQRELQAGRSTLGPDLDNDTFKEKREKMLRKLDYAKAVQVKNTQELKTKKPTTFPRQKEQDDMLSKRKLAVEYARNVPKPTVKPKASAYNNYEEASKLSPIAKPAKGQQRPGQQKASVEVLDMDKLHKRHQQDKRSAEIIQQKAQGVVS